ncbi:MAG: hypothetical protein HY774_24410 [Acidobacteria bacterium]|nr:hypothetical protein [Acidobacteriota bacterium]
MSNGIPNLSNLFQNALDDGVLSPQSFQALNLVDIGAQIQAGLGISVNNINASEVVLVTMMVDDSGSIRFGKNTQHVRDGHNAVLQALMASKQNNNILAHTGYLNGYVLFPYLPLATVDEAEKNRSGKIVYVRNKEVQDLTPKNYNPNLGTPLYDQSVVLLGRVLAKYQEFADGGVSCRTVTLIITDGADEHSTKAKAKNVKSLVDDLLGEKHIVAAMGISDGYTDFRKVFKEMGIRDEWILTPGNSAQEIRQAFQVFSQSAVRASQGAASFSKTAAGGFFCVP